MARCCACQSQPPAELCLTQITSADLAELLYVYGLDENLCPKYAEVAEQFQFLDCEGNVIAPNTPLVTCAAFAERLCETIATLATGGSVILGVTQVVGADCLTYSIPETPINVIDTSTIDFTASGPFNHTITGVVRVSADAGNIIEVHADGIYATVDGVVCEQIADFTAGAPVVFGVTEVVGADCLTHTVPATPPTVVSVLDTPSVDMTITGPPGSQVISADVNLSDTPGNVTIINIDGIYTPGVCTQIAPLPSGVYVPGVTQLVGRDCNVYVIPAGGAETPITVIDTASVDLTASGVLNHTISATVNIDPDVTNIIQITEDGIFANVDITPVDSDCIDLTIVESPDGIFTIEANPIISSLPGNSLQCLPDGLYTTALAPGTFTVVEADDTNCLNLNAAFDGIDTYTITGEPIIAPTINNDLSCTLTGLNVPGVDVLDSTCINMTHTLTGNQHIISASPIISPTAGNTLVCSGNGLYVPTPTPATPVTVADTNCINLTLTGQQISADPILSTTYPGFGPGCNSLVCTATGLAAPPDHNVLLAAAVDPGTATVVYPALSAPVLLPLLSATLTNTTCRNAYVFVAGSHPNVTMFNQIPNVDYFEVNSVINFVLPGYVPGPLQYMRSGFAGLTLNGATPGHAMSGSGAVFALSPAQALVPPGGVCTVTFQVNVVNNFGPNAISAAIGDYGINMWLETIS